MSSNNLKSVKASIPTGVQLIAVSKTKSPTEILEVYNAGQRLFGENKVQELTDKYEELPKDIQWHLIGHLQSNKVKYIAPFVSMIHSVDSIKLLQEIDKQALKNNRIIDYLLQIHIAEEETKFGLDFIEAETLLHSTEFKDLKNARLRGLMGMATNTDDHQQVQEEFRSLKHFYDLLKAPYKLDVLSMGMTSDYKLAIEEGSNMVRIGSAIFGERIMVL